MAAVAFHPVQCRCRGRRGVILVLTVFLLVILGLLGAGLIRVSEGAHEYAVQLKREAAALAAAEAACEQAVFWMSQQTDILSALQNGSASSQLTFPDSAAGYQVRFVDFVGYRPIFEILSRGQSGAYSRTIRLHVVQAISGWEMGVCRIPSGTTSTSEVNFSGGEVIDMPVHINSYGEPDDYERDIYIHGSPTFLRSVSMGESRYSAWGSDKYRDIMNAFNSGIYFNQPESRISDEEVVNTKIESFKAVLQDQRPDLILVPEDNHRVPHGLPAVQLEFFVAKDGLGYVRITNDCTVRGYERPGGSSNTWDYRITPGSGGDRFEKYPIYGYHYIPSEADQSGKRVIRTLKSTEVTPTFNGVLAPPGGQIYVDGNVIIGSAAENESHPLVARLNCVQGRITVAASGNIWIADSIVVSDRDDEGGVYPRGVNCLPDEHNPNALGLVAQGVIKVVDPGMVEALGGPDNVRDAEYQPIGIRDSGSWWNPSELYERHLPDPVIVEAGLTVGGGGWGAENVRRGYYGGRKETSGSTDDLVVRGTITEAIRGVVGVIGSDGFVKYYYLDERLLNGIVPGNIWLKGKYIPTPGGWDEFREQAD